jgi:hypothetical protein
MAAKYRMEYRSLRNPSDGELNELGELGWYVISVDVNEVDVVVYMERRVRK